MTSGVCVLRWFSLHLTGFFVQEVHSCLHPARAPQMGVVVKRAVSSKFILHPKSWLTGGRLLPAQAGSQTGSSLMQDGPLQDLYYLESICSYLGKWVQVPVPSCLGHQWTTTLPYPRDFQVQDTQVLWSRYGPRRAPAWLQGMLST